MNFMMSNIVLALFMKI